MARFVLEAVQIRLTLTMQPAYIKNNNNKKRQLSTVLNINVSIPSTNTPRYHMNRHRRRATFDHLCRCTCQHYWNCLSWFQPLRVLAPIAFVAFVCNPIWGRSFAITSHHMGVMATFPLVVISISDLSRVRFSWPHISSTCLIYDGKAARVRSLHQKVGITMFILWRKGCSCEVTSWKGRYNYVNNSINHLKCFISNLVQSAVGKEAVCGWALLGVLTIIALLLTVSDRSMTEQWTRINNLCSVWTIFIPWLKQM